MKKLLLSFFTFLCLQLVPTKAQWVTIPDSDFVAYLSTFYPMCMNGNQMDTTCSAILYQNAINVEQYNIYDLTGIQYFKNLTDLYCADNSLTTLSNLPQTLEVLFCPYNQLISLSDLPSSLVFLDCGNNQLTSFPNLPNNLSVLNCNDNLITSLSILPPNLTFLDCQNNQITNIASIPPTLEGLICNNNQLISLSNVPMLMTKFMINNNNISCIANLPQVIDASVNANILSNPLTCVPNQTDYSLGLPLCINDDSINNPFNCSIANLVGHIFTDQNSNCTHDIVDLPIENIPVKLLDSLNNVLSTSYTISGVI